MISLRTLSIQIYACSHLKWNLCNAHPSSKFTVWLHAISQRIHFRLFVCLGILGDVVEVVIERTCLRAVVACGNGWGVRIKPGIWRAVWKVRNPKPLLTSVNPFKNCKPCSFKHFGKLKDKNSPPVAISREAGVAAICRMKIIVYRSLQSSCWNKESKQRTNSLLAAANFILHIQANTLLPTAATG